MDRVAVFIDAGFVYAQGAKVVAGKASIKRQDVMLNVPLFIEDLTKHATAKSGLPLLRHYWFDGAEERSTLSEHVKLAYVDNVKTRFGRINAQGEQKGVDALLIADLTELARNHAIADAVLVTGDEDFCTAVEAAQSHGVRVHLLGFGSGEGERSQAWRLMRAADTTDEWDADRIGKFLSVRAVNQPLANPNPILVPPGAAAESPKPIIDRSTESVFSVFTPNTRNGDGPPDPG